MWFRIWFWSKRRIHIWKWTQKSNDNLSTQQQSSKDKKSYQTAKVNTEKQGLNVRKGKGTDFAVIKSAAKNSTVEVITPDDGSGWTEVKLSDGTKGFVSTKWLDFSNE